MYTARFLYNIYEEKYAINPVMGFNQEWKLAPEHCGVGYPMGYKANNVMRYVKLKEEDVLLHEEDTEIFLAEGDKVRVKDEVVKIVSVVKNLNGIIEYHIDKQEYIPINTRETFFDERQKNLKPEPPECRVVYENFTGTEKEYNFWKKIFKK